LNVFNIVALEELRERDQSRNDSLGDRGRLCRHGRGPAGPHRATAVSATRLYLRCLVWGLATGAAVGGGVGLVIGTLLAIGTGPALAAVALAVGIIYGTIVAIVPTVIGSLVVAVVLVRRHPHPASSDGVHRDLALVFAAVVAALDLVVVAYWLTLGGSLSEMLVALAVLLLVDAAVAAMLKPARTSIARAWVEG
jgi:hypothetical protein